jgi:glycerate kinase
MEATRFDERLAGSVAVVTGEGKFDSQSFHGKTVGGVLEAARRRGRPAGVVCGRAEAEAPGVPVVALVDLVGPRRAFEDAERAVEEGAAHLAGRTDWLPAEGAR